MVTEHMADAQDHLEARTMQALGTTNKNKRGLAKKKTTHPPTLQQLVKAHHDFVNHHNCAMDFWPPTS